MVKRRHLRKENYNGGKIPFINDKIKNTRMEIIEINLPKLRLSVQYNISDEGKFIRRKKI